MFNNLVESAPHRNEFQRRGSFFIGTLTAYAVLFLITGVASIYAYDAHLESGTMEMLAMVEPVPPMEEARPRVPNERPRPVERSSERNNTDMRTVLMASVNRPEVPPDKISTARNEIPPVREGIPTAIGNRNSNALIESEGGPTIGPGVGTNITTSTQPRVKSEEPPPLIKPAVTTPPKTIRTSRVLNGEARRLPNPPYPELAKRAGAEGLVTVQILIDERGKVVSARAVNGNPLLRSTAEQAAMQALFSPTTLNGETVKVSGTITFNFKLH